MQNVMYFFANPGFAQFCFTLTKLVTGHQVSAREQVASALSGSVVHPGQCQGAGVGGWAWPDAKISALR